MTYHIIHRGDANAYDITQKNFPSTGHTIFCSTTQKLQYSLTPVKSMAPIKKYFILFVFSLRNTCILNMLKFCRHHCHWRDPKKFFFNARQPMISDDANGNDITGIYCSKQIINVHDFQNGSFLEIIKSCRYFHKKA